MRIFLNKSYMFYAFVDCLFWSISYGLMVTVLVANVSSFIV